MAFCSGLVKDKLLQILHDALSQVEAWDEARMEVSAQLASIANLIRQLENVQQHCRSKEWTSPQEKAGSEGRILASMERTFASVQRDRRRVREVSSKMRKCSKKAESLFTYVVGQHGCLEAACQRNAEEFSVGDCVEWLRELQFVYGLDSDQKLAALDSLQEYDYQAVSELCKLWAIKPQHSVQEILMNLRYMVSTSSSGAS